jgi:hypothetical protein
MKHYEKDPIAMIMLNELVIVQVSDTTEVK